MRRRAFIAALGGQQFGRVLRAAKCEVVGSAAVTSKPLLSSAHIGLGPPVR